jgi:hypothetical protein
MQEASAGATNAEVFFGAAIDPSMKGRVQVIIVATGVGGQPLGSVIEGASHILLKHTAPDSSQPASVSAQFSRLAMSSSAQPAPVLRKPIAASARVPVVFRPSAAMDGSSSEKSEADIPSVARTAVIPSAVAEPDDATAVYSMEELEIPAFLRRRMTHADAPAARALHGAT